MKYTIFNIGDKIWKTKDCKEIKYRDLSIDHIKNIAKKQFRHTTTYEDYGCDVDCISFENEMQIELLRRTICKTLDIEL